MKTSRYLPRLNWTPIYLILSFLSTTSGSQVVHHRPLSTECPASSRPSTVLHHNDRFFFGDDRAGHFPDIKRGVPLHSESAKLLKSLDELLDEKRHGDIDKVKPARRDSVKYARSVRLGDSDEAESKRMGVETEHPDSVLFGDSEKVLESLGSHHHLGNSGLGRFENPDDLSDVGTPYSVLKRYGRSPTFSLLRQTRNNIGENNAAVSGKLTPFDKTARHYSTRLNNWTSGFLTRNLASADHYPTKRQEGTEQQLTPSKPQPTGRRHLQKMAEILKEFHGQDDTFAGPTLGMVPLKNTTGSSAELYNDRALRLLLHCLANTPADLSQPRSTKASGQVEAQNFPEHQQKRNLLSHSATHFFDLVHKSEELLDKLSKEFSSLEQDVLKSLLFLADLGEEEQETALKDVLKLNREVSKRLSFVHPNCLNRNLEFLKSASNIDAELLQSIKELTETIVAPPEVGVPGIGRPREKASSPVREEEVSGRWTEKRSGVKLADKASDKIKDTPPSLARQFGTINQDNLQTQISQSFAELDQFLSEKFGTPSQVDAIIASQSKPSSKVSGAEHAGKARESSVPSSVQMNPQKHETSTQVSGTQVMSKKTHPPRAFSSHAPLPWTCPSHTRWRDLGHHVFPRYVQETFCAENDNSSPSDNSDTNMTCWYGFYHCRPTTSAVQVLVRHSGSCNDSRVPQNIRRHYFLSIISIDTGCVCQ